MNWVFWVLIILALAAIWFGLTILFKPFGGFLTKIFKDTKNVIEEETKEDENE